jgi:hypothetical protein
MSGTLPAQSLTLLIPSLDIPEISWPLHFPPLLLLSQDLLMDQSSSGKLVPSQQLGTDPKSISLTPVTIMSITLQAKDNIFITSDSDGVVKTWDIFTGVCKASFQTPAKGANKRDVQLINGRLFLLGIQMRRLRSGM